MLVMNIKLIYIYMHKNIHQFTHIRIIGIIVECKGSTAGGRETGVGQGCPQGMTP